MSEMLRICGQIVIYALVAVVLGSFANSPDYRHFPADKAMLKLSFVHGGKRECRKFTADEIAALPANMRRPMDCPRERPPVYVEIDLDGAPLFRAELPPSGLSGDGPSHIYRRFTVEPGPHVIDARLRDTAGDAGFDYSRHESIALTPGESLVIDFRSETGGFVIQ